MIHEQEPTLQFRIWHLVLCFASAMELLISLISHVAFLCVTWFDFAVFILEELSILSLWQLQVVLKRTFYQT